VCREARDGACVMYKEEVRAERAGAGERINKQGEPEMRQEVKAAKVTCTEGTTTGQCKTGKCVSIDTDTVCTECGKAGEVPINGECKAYNDAATTKDAGAGCETGGDASEAVGNTAVVCGKCSSTTNNYFLFMGGCYDKTKSPGNKICTTASGGRCTTCKADSSYIFQNPAASPTLGSECILCWDTTGANEVVGVENCATCAAPSKAPGVATCSKCATGALYTPSEGATSCPATCPEGYFEHTATDGSLKTCQSCSAPKESLTPPAAGVLNCAKCTYNTKVICEKCGQDKYLKTDGETTSCVDAQDCGTGFFATTVEGIKKCFACGDTTNGVPNCAECTAPGEGKTKPTCTKCSTKYLKTAADGTTTCVEQGECTSDSFPVTNAQTGNKCISCGDETSGVPNCVKCTAPSSAGGKPTCSECGSGFKLEGGACVSASTNKSALSTGAIAGISVAAVVVVGGLVGFLCWWFVCRGKA
ncbi:Variant-specific surface protein, partial [Giardia duodenalis]